MPTQQTTLQKKRNISYLNKDFQDFRRDIVESHLKVYFKDTYQDFNESSVGMMMVELVAFIGDNLSFYLDKKFSESFIDTAREMKNILKHGRQLGFKAFGKTSAFGTVDCFIKVPAININNQLIPDMRYAGLTHKGAKLKGVNGQTYETLEDADFSTVDITNPLLVAPVDLDPTTKAPITFALYLKNISIKAGETRSTTVTVGAYQPFLKVTLPDPDVLEVISVTDAQNNIWYEVDFLAQDTVFTSLANTGADSTQVPYVLKLTSAPYRFVTDFDIVQNRMSLIFGTGDASSFDQDLVPNLGDLSIPAFGKDSFTDFSLDPQNFLRTRTLGLAPVNTTLTVKYRVGGGQNTNAGVHQITTVADLTFDVANSTLSANTIRDVKNSFAVINSRPVQGGRDQLQPQEVKQLIAANFATQQRAVTADDFVARALSMPAKFGSIFRAAASAGLVNRNAVELTILSKDTNGNAAVASSTLKQNLKSYLARFRMLTDAIELLDGQIINIGLSFSILVKPEFNKTDVLTDILNRLQEFFIIDKWQIAQPINLTDIHYLIADTPGVLSVYQINVINLAGTLDGRVYSQTAFNIQKNTKNNIIYCDKASIFAVQFPSKDITGIAK